MQNIEAFLPSTLTITIFDDSTPGSYEIKLASKTSAEQDVEFPAPLILIPIDKLDTSTTYEVSIKKCEGKLATKVCSLPSTPRSARTHPKGMLSLHDQCIIR